MFADPVLFLVGTVFLLPAILVAIPVHELGHGLAAYWMGDSSVRNRGFLTLRPMRFVNAYSAITAVLLNVGLLGNQIPINQHRLRSAGRRIVYALAGPAASLLVAALFGALLRVLLRAGAVAPVFDTRVHAPLDYLATLVYAAYFLNLATFALQMLPFPGLDGWKVIEAIFRDRNPQFFWNVDAQIQRLALVAIAVIVLGPLVLHFSPLGAVVGIFFQPAATAILGQCTGYTVLYPCPLSGLF